jgi:hypothetical protein
MYVLDPSCQYSADHILLSLVSAQLNNLGNVDTSFDARLPHAIGLKFDGGLGLAVAKGWYQDHHPNFILGSKSELGTAMNAEMAKHSASNSGCKSEHMPSFNSNTNLTSNSSTGSQNNGENNNANNSSTRPAKSGEDL